MLSLGVAFAIVGACGSDGSSSSPQHQEPVFEMPEEVSQAVGAITRTCAEMEDDALMLNGDVEVGHVDHAWEWERYHDAREQYTEVLVDIGAWKAELQSLIKTGASSNAIDSHIQSLPIGTGEETINAEELHEQFVAGSLEPPDFEFSANPPTHLSMFPRALLLIAEYGPGLIEAGKTIYDVVQDWRDRGVENEKRRREQLADELDDIDCPDAWPQVGRPGAVAWGEETCNPVGRQSSVAGKASGGPSFEIRAPHPPAIRSVDARHGALLDAIGLTFDAAGAPPRLEGGTGGKFATLELAPGEAVVEVAVTYDRFVNAVTVRTSHGRSVTFGSTEGSNASPEPRTRVFAVPDGAEFAGLVGQYSVFRPNSDATAVNAVGCLFVEA